MSIFPISTERKDSFGSVIPQIVYYIPASQMNAPITFINAATIQYKPHDYAKELLDRVRYLRTAYAIPIGPKAIAPTAQAFSDAEAFIRRLPLQKTGMPTINVASDGEVNFDWSNAAAQIDLGFFGDGTYSYYARGGKHEISGDSIALTADVPEQLISIASAAA